MTEFTPISAFLGGSLIGLSAFLFLLFNGRIAGISGIISNLLNPSKNKSNTWVNVAFLVGIIGAPLLLINTPYKLMTTYSVTDNIWLIIVAGLFVGFGTNIGSGCTSGHGICGIGRLSTRSIVATLTFMFTAFITVFFIKFL